MADVYGVQATKHEAGGPANTVDSGMADSPVLCMIDTYEADSLAAGAAIQMGKKLPAGAKIVNILLHADALGGSTQLSCGDSDTEERYLAAYASTSATKKSLLVDGVIGGVGYEVGTADGDDRILVTNTSSGAATGTIECIVFYTMNR